MPYASLALLTARYGEAMLVDLTDRETPATGAIVTEVVDRALADTDAMIDGFLAGRYQLPLSAQQPLLVDIALRVAIYKLHREVVADKIKSDYDGALGELKMISIGTIRLSAAGIEPAASGSSGVRTNDRERDMTPDNLKGFV